MKRLILYIALFFACTSSFSQSINDLRDQKQRAVEAIKVTNDLLLQVSANQKATLDKLKLLNSQITKRNQLITSMKSEVSILQEVIDDNTLAVEMMSTDLEEIKKEYARMIQYAYRNRNATDKILFFLSAEDFNQAYRRFVYFKQYTEQRKNQLETIVSLQDLLWTKLSELEEQKRTQQGVMSEQVNENKKLESEKKQQNSTSKQLQGQQKQLSDKLAQQRKIEQQLEQEIQRIIEEEARKSTGATQGNSSGGKGFALTPEQKLIGDNFEQNKNRLPWPVEKGAIVEHFGVHPHLVLNNVTVNNNGVNIATEIGAKARAVFNGEVSRVFGITGGNTAVIVRHGQYLSVYSNLINVTVKKGDKVSVSQHIGTVYTDPSDGNKTTLKFQIWKESVKLNPEEWLGR
ncbi:MAG: peptidoglycan DD-metalloendopeptidase family protein [Prolixibacteraceae bacterium]|nr:peptidoglycan DD-metalloendopeptidase family protein [Prolixibacteraceae bacterium]